MIIPDEQVQAVLNLVPFPSLVLDTVKDTIIAANYDAEQLFGRNSTDLIGKAFYPYLGLSPVNFLVFLDEVCHRKRAWTRDVELVSADGRELSCEIRAESRQLTEGRITLSFIDLCEIEQRAGVSSADQIQQAGLMEWQRAQNFFSELERQNQLILNAAGEGIYGVNADGKTTFVNRAAQEMLGWTVDDLMGKDIHTMIHHHHLGGESYPSEQCPIYQSFRFEKVHRIEDEVFWCKTGKPIRVEYISTPVYDQSVLAGAVVIFRDITERKESEKKLHNAMIEVTNLRQRLEEENAYLQAAITTERAHHDIVGASPAIQQLRTKIELVAKSDASVIISGEAGTGKALVASAVHKSSNRARRVLIHFKCGSAAPDALEAELFGYMKGAFPGALRDTAGKLELADHGTLHLDDISELPLSIQGHLLDALQTGMFTRLGDNRKRKVDVRLICSTTRDLALDVAANHFREDLFFFLNVFPLHCCTLRERHEDIPVLASHLLTLSCRRLNRPVPIITEGTMKKLQSYHWPGNVRELGNVIERGAIVSRAEKLVVEVGGSTAPKTTGPQSILTETEIEQLKAANLIACLKAAKGRVSGPGGAAEMLGVRNTTFHSRLKSHGISPKEWD